MLSRSTLADLLGDRIINDILLTSLRDFMFVCMFHRYGKLVELRRHMEYFKASGKTLVAYMDSGAEKEYYAALGCDEVGP